MRHELNGHRPRLLIIGVLARGEMLVLAMAVMIVAITAIAAGQGGHYLSWAVFATLIVIGLVTAGRQNGTARRRHLLLTGVTPSYIAASVLALEEGGPAILASLVLLASLVYVVVARWLPMLRRVIAPVASRTALMLIAVMILPFAIALMRSVPENAGARASPTVVAVMLTAIVLFVVCTPRVWRPC